MAAQEMRFDDGAGYERMMGAWSQLAGEVFVDWLAPPSGLRWIDIGCGTGAFTELLLERCCPEVVHGVDPSEDQLAFARPRLATRPAQFQVASATALPYAAGSFDAAVMALVIVFVPDPAKGVREMARVVRPGGTAAAYAWDILDGGSPLAPVLDELLPKGPGSAGPAQASASHIDALRDFWRGAGLEAVQTRRIDVRRDFADFDDFWISLLGAPSVRPAVAALCPREVQELKERVRMRIAADRSGRLSVSARANAVKGRVPA